MSATTSAGAAETALVFARLARILESEGPETMLEKVCEMAVETIEPCEHAGVSIVERSGIRSRASSGDVPRIADEIQDRAGQGPCHDAIKDAEMRSSDDLETDARWPAFSRPVFETCGIRSVMSFRLYAGEETFGAVNFYSSQRAAFGAAEQALGDAFTAHASMAVAHDRRQHQLGEALRSRDVIGQAKGLIMAREAVSGDEAFERLRQASQAANVPLRVVAAELLDEHAVRLAGS